MPRILLTNDDGISAEGLRALKGALKPLGELQVVAPDRQCSASGSSLSLYDPLTVRRYREEGIVHHVVRGTPADCVKLALHELLEEKPDVVVSGMNNGLNTASNIFYSGTVAAAFEASMFGIPAFAVSSESSPDLNWNAVARRASAIISRLLSSARPGIVYNINLPAKNPKGVLTTRQEMRIYPEKYDRRTDPRGRLYFWLHGSPERRFTAERRKQRNGALPTDAWALANGFISVTPLQRDWTNHEGMDDLRRRVDE